jgi:hypothetical protein
MVARNPLVVSSARIELDLRSVERHPGGAVTGPIWIVADATDLAFPEAAWSDSPVALLGSWLPALRQLATRGDAAECHFMDGPYHFTASAAGPDAWRVACFESRERPSVSNAIAELTVNPVTFLASAVAAARGILGYCDVRGWWDADSDRLRSALSSVDPDGTT